VRQLILDAVAAHEEAPRAEGTGVMRWRPVGEHRERLEIRLNASELHALGLQAASSGFTANRWVLALNWGATDACAPVQRAGDGAARRLASCARDDQPVTGTGASRDGPGWTDCRRGKGRLLVTLKAQIDAHLRAVSELVPANIDHWSRYTFSEDLHRRDAPEPG
jgi:hypothetical protein